ncbi:MAG TPA: hypothetical protein VNY24_06845 [Candidatus Acidoferrales bacterium]|jgi:hypothetical protein|nr:hypothetical protein [Candidatus Acidoferrales bacterium]
MNQPKKRGISRRQFAQRAALLSASASIVPAASVFAEPMQTPPATQTPAAHPNLSAESQVEAEARYQQILSQYGSRFSAEEKVSLREMNLVTQASLDKVRAFSLENGDAPALYLKPLVEREKKPVQPPAAAPAKKS